MKYTTIVNDQTFEIEIQSDGTLLVNGEPLDADFLDLGNSLFSIIADGKALELAIEEDRGDYEILMGGRLYEAQVLDERAMLMLNRKGGLKLSSGELHSPMPGLIVEVLVNEGDTVAEGDTLVILESMKMQNELKAPRGGIVQTLNAKSGENVDKNDLLVVVVDTDADLTDEE